MCAIANVSALQFGSYMAIASQQKLERAPTST